MGTDSEGTVFALIDVEQRLDALTEAVLNLSEQLAMALSILSDFDADLDGMDDDVRDTVADLEG